METETPISPTSEQARWLADADAALEQALAEADTGQVIDASEVFDRLLAKYAAMLDAPAKHPD